MTTSLNELVKIASKVIDFPTWACITSPGSHVQLVIIARTQESLIGHNDRVAWSTSSVSFMSTFKLTTALTPFTTCCTSSTRSVLSQSSNAWHRRRSFFSFWLHLLNMAVPIVLCTCGSGYSFSEYCSLVSRRYTGPGGEVNNFGSNFN